MLVTNVKDTPLPLEEYPGEAHDIVAGVKEADTTKPYPLASGTQKKPSAAPWIVREEPISTTRQVGKRLETNTEKPGSVAHSDIMPQTMYIWPDEKCMHYSEEDLLDPEWKTYRRYRTVIVVRNDALAQYREDMGPADKVPGGPVNIVGGEGHYIMETWNSMCEIADQWRAQTAPMPHDRFEMKAFERTPDMKDILPRKVI